MTTLQGGPTQEGALKSAAIGAVFAIDTTGHCLAMATILFAGALATGLPLATSIFVLGSAVMMLLLSRFGAFALPLAISQDTSIAILAPAVTAAGLAAGPAEAGVATAFAVIGVSAILTGAAFWITGRFGLGRLVRLFPYPVAAGFLASSGVLLVLAGFAVLTGSYKVGAIIAGFADPNTQVLGLIAGLLAISLLCAVRFGGGAVTVLAIMAGFIGAYYAYAAATGLSREEAVALGLLASPGEAGPMEISPQLLTAIDWGQVALALPVLAAVMFINLIGVMLNISGVELGTRTDIDVGRELRVTGLGNLGLGAFGALSTWMSGGSTLAINKIGVSAGPAVIGGATVLVAAAIYAEAIVAAVPIFVSTGLLMFIGLSMLDDWMVSSIGKLSWLDRLVLLSIVGATLVFGILPAIGLGLILALATFAIGLGRVPLLRLSSDAARRPSAVDRAPSERRALAEIGPGIRILHLQGALFFGSVERLNDDIKDHRAAGKPLSAIIFDLADVSYFDSTACSALVKLSYLCGDLPGGLHLSGLSRDLQTGFARWGMPLAEAGEDDLALAGKFLVWTGLDDAIEWTESRLLAAENAARDRVGLGDALRELTDNHPRAEDLRSYFEQVALADSETLLRHGAEDRDAFVLEHGRLGVYLQDQDGSRFRVRAMGPGAIVGELATFLGGVRSADVIADGPASVWKLSAEALARMHQDDPELWRIVFAGLGRSVAAKLTQTNALLAHELARDRG